MNCVERESDLLMLAHGQATFFDKLKSTLHLILCSTCRSRLKDFQSLSKGLAATLENPTLGIRPIKRWTRLELLGTLVVLLFILSSVIAYMNYRGQSAFCEDPAPKIEQKKTPMKINEKMFPHANFSTRSCD